MRLIYRFARSVRREAIEGVWGERDIGRKRTKSIRFFEYGDLCDHENKYFIQIGSICPNPVNSRNSLYYRVLIVKLLTDIRDILFDVEGVDTAERSARYLSWICKATY